MEIHRSLGVSRLVAFMAAHRGKSAHERLLARLDRSIAEARDLCERAEDLCPDQPERGIAGAFQTVLARPARDWMHRAAAVVTTVRTDGDTICGARARVLRQLIDGANVAMLRSGVSDDAWHAFYRSVRQSRFSDRPGTK